MAARAELAPPEGQRTGVNRYHTPTAELRESVPFAMIWPRLLVCVAPCKKTNGLSGSERAMRLLRGPQSGRVAIELAKPLIQSICGHRGLRAAGIPSHGSNE